MKCADPGTFTAEFKYRSVIFPQYFSVQRPCQLRSQDQTRLVLAEQPTGARVFVRNTVVFTKSLAPLMRKQLKRWAQPLPHCSASGSLV